MKLLVKKFVSTLLALVMLFPLFPALDFSAAAAEVPELGFYGASLTLENDLTVNFAVEKDLIDNSGITSPRVIFTMGERNVTVTEYQDSQGYYLFSFSHLPPQLSCDTLTATLCADYNGKEYMGKTMEYSVARYCKQALADANSSVDLKILVADLMQYAAAAQEYVGYKTDALATALLTEEEKFFITRSIPEAVSISNASYKEISSPAVVFTGASLFLKESISVNLQFTAAEINGLYVEVREENGTLLSTLTEQSFNETTEGFSLRFGHLYAWELRKPLFFTFYDAAGKAVSNTLRYSVESYVAIVHRYGNGAEPLIALLNAMLNYGLSAENYNSEVTGPMVGNAVNANKISEDLEKGTIVLDQQEATTKTPPSFTFYYGNEPLSGASWAVRGTLRAQTTADKSGHIVFTAMHDADNVANVLINRAVGKVNGIYRNLTLEGERTPSSGNEKFSDTLVDTTDWTAEFIFLFYNGKVALYLKEPGEDFVCMSEYVTLWEACTAMFGVNQYAKVTLSQISMTKDARKVREVYQTAEGLLEDPIESKKVLFIGNSATYVNDLPQMLSQLSRKAGYNLEADSIVKSSATLAQQCNAATVQGRLILDAIQQGDYDVVFLQEHTGCIATDAKRAETAAAAATLEKAIREAGATPVFYVRPPTKVDKNGYNTYEQCLEYDKLFVKIAGDLGMENAFVNRAFAYAVKEAKLSVSLWGDDDAHTSLEGAYLSVCVFFSTLFNTSATALDSFGLDKALAQTLQGIADEVTMKGYVPAPLPTAVVGDAVNGSKITENVEAGTIVIDQPQATTKTPPSFTFYFDNAPLSGAAWAVRGTLRAQTTTDKSGHIVFTAKKDASNVANVLINRRVGKTNGIYKNITVDGVRTPSGTSNELVSNTLIDTTDWTAEFIFLYGNGTVSLYLKEAGEEFTLMTEFDVDWSGCTAMFGVNQYATVTLSNLSLTEDSAEVNKLLADLEAKS